MALEHGIDLSWFDPSSVHNDPSSIVQAPDLDALAQVAGYPDFAAMQADEPELAQQLSFQTNGNVGGGASNYQAPGPRGFRTVPWRDLATNFGIVAGAAGADAALGGAEAAPSLSGEVTPFTGAGLPSAELGVEGAGAVGTGVTGGVAGAADGITSVTPGPGFSSSELVGGGSNLAKYANLAKTAAGAIGGATKAAANNRGEENNFNIDAAKLGIEGQTAFQNELVNRAKLEADQRKTDLSNIYKSSVAHNQPATSGFERMAGRQNAALSPEFLAALDSLTKQGGQDLSKGPTFDASTMPGPTFDPSKLPTFKKPGKGETIGDWAGPILAGVGSLYGV